MGGIINQDHSLLFLIFITNFPQLVSSVPPNLIFKDKNFAQHENGMSPDAPSVGSTSHVTTSPRNHFTENHRIDRICGINNYRNFVNTEPIITVEDPLVINCAFQYPIQWDVLFEPKLRVAKGSLPYQVTSQYKECPSDQDVEQSTSYFEIKLEFSLRNMEQNLKVVDIQCASILNPKSFAIWWINNTIRAGLNLMHGKQDRGLKASHSASKESCRELELRSNALRTSFSCFNNKSTDYGGRQVKYINCSDWSNCQQLVAHKFPNICQGSWNPSYCGDPHKGTCQSHLNSSIESGIIYCNKHNSDSGLVFYAHVFKLLFPKDSGQNHEIIVNNSMDSVLPDLRPVTHKCKIGKTVEARATKPENKNCKLENFGYQCLAHKFMAMKNFEWSFVFRQGDVDVEAPHCKIRHLDELLSFKEEIICKFLHVDQEIEVEVLVTCKVYLQSGIAKSVHASQNYKLEATRTHDVLQPLVGAGACLMVLLPCIILCYCKVRRQQRQIDFSAEEEERFRKGAIMMETLGQNRSSADVLPYDMNLEIPREKITIEPVLLGKGAFGKVLKGRVESRFVAIKTINKNADGQYFRALLSELKIMSFVGKHPNIVELVGANTEKIRKHDVYLIFEFCENGNVLEYIRARREVFVDQLIVTNHSRNSIREYEYGLSQKLCTQDLIRWSMEIASGMNYIASRNVYHGDLAARNILLTRNLVAKVGDFGLARELKDYSLYVQKLGCPLPLKWMAIESLRDLEFSIQSDVWSYGVTLWEMFSLGSTPYPGVEWNFQAWKRLMGGERMDKASNAPESIHEIVLKCWQTLPKDRPSFGELHQMLREELEKL